MLATAGFSAFDIQLRKQAELNEVSNLIWRGVCIDAYTLIREFIEASYASFERTDDSRLAFWCMSIDPARELLCDGAFGLIVL